MDETDITQEFLIESREGLGRLDQEIVQLEQNPRDARLLDSIFRTVHTIKGTGGMLGFTGVESIAHLSETLLSQLRSGERDLTSQLVSLILKSVDAIKNELASIEDSGKEAGVSHDALREELRQACHGQPAPPLPPTATPSESANSPTKTQNVEGSNSRTVSEDSTIRVDVLLLDRLMNLVGELVLARNQILQVNTTRQDSSLHASSQRLDMITTELQENVMKTRMQPIGVVWNKLPRVARDLAAQSSKSIRVELDGAETELDRTIIEAIKDPLTHLVRNCCDHGIELPAIRAKAGKPEQGTILLRAYHEGGQVNIEISDDGAGIDPLRLKEHAKQNGILSPEVVDRMSERELLDLIFLPGFSTAKKVTNISGRGVGMDVVKTNIEKIGGAVDLTSRLGQGTTFKVKIPLTLAIIPGLVVTSGAERFVIPQVSLLELIGLEGEAGRDQIESVHGTPVYRRRGKLLPLVYLNRVLQIADANLPSESISIVVLQAEDQQFGLVVDAISDTQEIVVKPLGAQLKGLDCYAGACIMGDGRIALILDVMGIAQRANVISTARERGSVEKVSETVTAAAKQTFLLFEGPDGCRMAVPLSSVARLEELPITHIEIAGAQSVAQYRGQILPLVNLENALSERRRQKRKTNCRPHPADNATLPVVVCNHEQHQVGLLVDQILDIIEDSADLRHPASRPGVLYSAVIGGKVTELIDIPAVLRAANVKFTSQIKSTTEPVEVS
jgi:two-component system, chemotaxis family, sensor kinase CheA